MRHSIRNLFLAAAAALLATSCGTYKGYVLMNDIEAPAEYKAPVRHDLTIKKGDNLQIIVTHKEPRMVEAFNRITRSEMSSMNVNGYVVNNDGTINLPVFDTVRVTGMTCPELERYLTKRMETEGIVNGATVSVKIINFKVTVIGESGTGIHEFDDNDVTILDLVAKAGLAGSGSGGNVGYGSGIRRDKILVMRTLDTTVVTGYLNLLTKDVMYSPFYYLQQNDIVYVEPTEKRKKKAWRDDNWLSYINLSTSALRVAYVAVYRIIRGTR